jgi:RHS repeat-associated protein
VEQYSYDVYGKPTIRDGSTNVLSASAIGNRLMFNARDRDPDTLLYNYRYRYYSPGLGRFVQPDPLKGVGVINLYEYVSNNPINEIDPLGLHGCSNKEKCIQGCLDTYYGGNWVKYFSLQSIFSNPFAYAKGVGASVASKGLAVGTASFAAKAVSSSLYSQGAAVLAQPASNFGEVFGLQARALAAQSKYAAAAFAAKIPAALVRTLGVAGVGATAFATGAQLYCDTLCAGESDDRCQK